jgi:hypothetical protein
VTLGDENPRRDKSILPPAGAGPVVGQPQPITKTFGRNDNVNKVYQILSRAVVD